MIFCSHDHWAIEKETFVQINMILVILLMWGEETAYRLGQKIIPALESTPVNEVALNFSISAFLSIPTEFVNKLKICGPSSMLHSKI